MPCKLYNTLLRQYISVLQKWQPQENSVFNIYEDVKCAQKRE